MPSVTIEIAITKKIPRGLPSGPRLALLVAGTALGSSATGGGSDGAVVSSDGVGGSSVLNELLPS